MPTALSEFHILRLHGRRSVRIPIEDNKLILVGENGTGKTTLINFLYFFLSRQWERLAAYEFESVGATLGGVEIEVTRESIQESMRHGLRTFRHLSPAVQAALHDIAERWELADLRRDRRRLYEIARQYDLPTSILVEYFDEPSKGQLAFIDENQQKRETLKSLVQEQVLYLPTYRRIEQDLKSIFPGMDERMIRERLAKRQVPSGSIELVEFGMEDVERAVQTKMNQLKESNRTGLTNLASTYLRDVIGGEYRSISARNIAPAELQEIESVFSRIDEKMLPSTSKEKLRDIVATIQAQGEVGEEERVIALFLLKLLDLQKRQRMLEVNVHRFVDTCNAYLVGKKLRFDSDALEVHIELTDGSKARSEERETVNFRDLSSGEKQIVSLFSHLLLSDTREFFVLIDEPELSLSVPWQQSFLPDILKTERSTGLVAVTHSPFIFDNVLDPYGHNLSEFWSEE